MEKSEITRLRQLILNLDDTELEKLKQLLNSPNDLALEISKVLPEAVLFSMREGKKLSSAFVPMIETVITQSVTKNPNLLADALYPVIGRSIRKSINEEFKQMIATFNELIENTFSVQSFKWRYQALVTGRKYSEIVISNTIKYKAEHVFLIHRETGLLLNEVHDQMSKSADPDSISGMLKAISDFVHDSFEATGDSYLNLIEMEEFQVLIEQGPYAIVASVVKGFALDNYRHLLRETLEQIHKDYAASFASFDGDTFIFETSSDLLTKCLKTEKKEEFEKGKTEKKSKFGIIMAIPIVLFFMVLIGRSVYFSGQWRSYIKVLEQTDNILLSQYGKMKKTYFVHGMLLPGASHPDSLVAEFNFPRKRFKSYWHLYIPGDNRMVYSYIEENVPLPSRLELQILPEKIQLQGRVPEDWFISLKKFMTHQLPWFNIESDQLELINRKTIQDKIDRFVKTHFYFDLGAIKLTPESNKDMKQHALDVLAILEDVNDINKTISIQISGYTDPLGNVELNEQISIKRADFVKSELVFLGVPEAIITADGKGVSEETESLSDAQRRRVDFTISID